MTYTYHWQHTPSGKTGTGTIDSVTKAAALALVNTWNRNGAGRWVYWLEV